MVWCTSILGDSSSASLLLCFFQCSVSPLHLDNETGCWQSLQRNNTGNWMNATEHNHIQYISIFLQSTILPQPNIYSKPKSIIPKPCSSSPPPCPGRERAGRPPFSPRWCRESGVPPRRIRSVCNPAPPLPRWQTSPLRFFGEVDWQHLRQIRSWWWFWPIVIVPVVVVMIAKIFIDSHLWFRLSWSTNTNTNEVDLIQIQLPANEVDQSIWVTPKHLLRKSSPAPHLVLEKMFSLKMFTYYTNVFIL